MKYKTATIEEYSEILDFYISHTKDLLNELHNCKNLSRIAEINAELSLIDKETDGIRLIVVTKILGLTTLDA